MGGSSSHTMAAPVVVNATAKHTASVIFLHGLGDTGHGWAEAFREISQPYIKYICPTAGMNPVSLNAGMVMPSWFDIKGLDEKSEQDVPGIKAASDSLKQLVEAEEKKGISRSRIMVGGFSQGGAVSLYTALRVLEGGENLAGILALSTWLPLHEEFPGGIKGNKETPVLHCHGQVDPLVPFDYGRRTSALLAHFNPNHSFKSYPGMAHSSSPEEMKDVKEFISKYLPPI